MERRRPVFPEFTSALSRTEAALVLGYFPVHLVLLPRLLGLLYERGAIDVLWANVLLYGVGFGYMLAASFRFLRRDFDPLIDRPLFAAGQVCSGYLLTDGAENMNNDALAELAEYSYGPMKAALVYLGPLTEEMLFRAGLFGTLRHKNRAAAYAVSMLAFSVYHVWGYALDDPGYWIFLLQYLPAGWLLARCYERTNSIWGSVFFHMLTNYMALELYNAVLRAA